MGQFFHLKYTVSYGFGIAHAKFDGIPTVNKPKCIGRIHLYSDMWKYFDHGLYEFLFIYIYKNLSNKLTASKISIKLFSSFTTFFFIYIWHGLYNFILIWSLLNYICLIIENFGRSITKTLKYRKFIENILSRNNELRFNAIIASQIFIPSAISNFYFFAGTEIGNIYIYKTYTSGIITYIFLTFCCCCIYNVSEFVKRNENVNNKKLK